MSTNTDGAQDGVITRYKDAPTRTIQAGGVTYAYRELGPRGGIPVVFFVHLAANLDNWDPRIIDPIAAEHHVIAFDNRGVGASSGTVPDSIEAMADDAANGDNDRMVPSVLSEDLHRRIHGSELVIYPDSGHGGIFQFHDTFSRVAVDFLKA
ncbi:MAG TPA: hypothetical protein VFL38_05315 [Humibacillus xanthopallidus]|nr:hypothetical protein [Humibacillus xanthopallidus]